MREKKKSPIFGRLSGRHFSEVIRFNLLEIKFKELRRGWDSNPRWREPPQRFSRPPRSAALAPLRTSPIITGSASFQKNRAETPLQFGHLLAGGKGDVLKPVLMQFVHQRHSAALLAVHQEQLLQRFLGGFSVFQQHILPGMRR